MLKIRLARVGRKHDPSYRVIVTEKGRAPQTGAYKEALGTYDPRSDEYDLKAERVKYWMSEGAKPSETVHNLLVKADIIDDDTVNPLPNNTPIKEDESRETPGEASAETGEGESEADSSTGSEDSSEKQGDSQSDDGTDDNESGSDSSGEEGDENKDVDEEPEEAESDNSENQKE